MAWRIVKQPNGLYARFSDIVDDFTDVNMTYERTLQCCAREGAYPPEDKIKGAEANPHRWEESLRTILAIHGQDAVRRAIRVSQPRKDITVKKPQTDEEVMAVIRQQQPVTRDQMTELFNLRGVKGPEAKAQRARLRHDLRRQGFLSLPFSMNTKRRG